MNLSNSSIRVAILGAQGIGSVHARIFKEMGADVCAILGSTDQSAKETSKILKTTLGIHVKYFSQLDDLLNNVQPDAISICTPNYLHFEQIDEAIRRNIDVFCEKPIFWHKGITIAHINRYLSKLESYSNSNLFVNTSNAYFVDRIINDFELESKEISSFSFRFHTNGKNHFRNIAVDLMPHAFSLLLHLSDTKKISLFSDKFSRHEYKCNFFYGNIKVEFDFIENIKTPKEFVLIINGRKFKRVTKGSGKNYRVFFKDDYTKKVVEMEDPFTVYIREFLVNCNTKDSIRDRFDEAAKNIRLMAEALLPRSEYSYTSK